MLKKSGLIFKSPVATVSQMATRHSSFIHYVYGQQRHCAMYASWFHSYPCSSAFT